MKEYQKMTGEELARELREIGINACWVENEGMIYRPVLSNNYPLYSRETMAIAREHCETAIKAGYCFTQVYIKLTHWLKGKEIQGRCYTLENDDENKIKQLTRIYEPDYNLLRERRGYPVAPSLGVFYGVIRVARQREYEAICVAVNRTLELANAGDYGAALTLAAEVEQLEDTYLFKYPDVKRVDNWRDNNAYLQSGSMVEKVLAIERGTP